MRSCEGLVDSLLYVIKACVNTSDFDSKVCTNTHAHPHTRIHTGQKHATMIKGSGEKLLLTLFFIMSLPVSK